MTPRTITLPIRCSTVKKFKDNIVGFILRHVALPFAIVEGLTNPKAEIPITRKGVFFIRAYLHYRKRVKENKK